MDPQNYKRKCPSSSSILSNTTTNFYAFSKIKQVEFHLVDTSRHKQLLLQFFSFSTQAMNFSNLLGDDFTCLTTLQTLTIDSLRSFSPSCTIKFKICTQHYILRNSQPRRLPNLSYVFLLRQSIATARVKFQPLAVCRIPVPSSVQVIVPSKSPFSWQVTVSLLYLGMATSRVQAGFFYTRIRPAGQDPWPGPDPLTKWVFFSGPTSPIKGLGLIRGPTKKKNFLDPNTNTNPNTITITNINTNTKITNTDFRSTFSLSKSQSKHKFQIYDFHFSLLEIINTNTNSHD